MDKYTVDLDQVLNDFEYSELTDNNGRNQPTTTTTTNSNFNKTTQSLPPSTSTTTTKHSINNVFHSLNEYLNSDIKTIDNITSNQETIVVDNIIGNETTTTIEEQHDEIVEDLNNEHDTKETEPIQEETKNVETIVEDTAKIDENENETETDNDNTNINPISNNNDKIISQPEKEEEQIEEKQLLSISNDNNDNNRIDEIKEEEEDDKIIEINHQTEQQQHIEEIIEKTDDNNSETVVEDNKIGFNDDIEIDDSELNQYLEELELEYESQQQQPQPVDEESEQQIEEESIEKTVERPKDLTLSTTTTTTENVESIDKRIDLIGDPGSTPFNNVYVDQELKQNQILDKTQDEDDVNSETSSDEDDDGDETTASISDESATELNQNEQQQQHNDNDEDSTETYHDAVDNQTTATTESSPPPPPPPLQEQQVAEDDDKNDWLGNQAPLWIPDNVATNCLHCDLKFTVIKRRHHCRACGLVLCSKCCYLKLKLQYLDDLARVCNKCYQILTKKQDDNEETTASTSEENSPKQQQQQQPNPNNPLEYCSTIPPHQQVDNTTTNPTPSVMVPVGVLKRKTHNNPDNNNPDNHNRVRRNKSVMFCDGIRPGSDLTNLDNDFSYQQQQQQSSKQPELNKVTKSFLTTTTDGDKLPPIIKFNKTGMIYEEFNGGGDVINYLKNNLSTFAININLFINLKIVNLDCCINKFVWCFITNGLINVGQDEIVVLLELLDNETTIPTDIFVYINNIYLNAIKGVTIKEMDLSLHEQQPQQHREFLDNKNHAGFLFIRPTFQCLQNLNNLLPQEPYLIGILIHRWETPWAKLFPLRLLLRLGAEYRYYPSPIISYRYRDSLFVEIGHTIINLLADFRNYSYTLTKINGLYIDMEEKITKIQIPKNRYKQIIKTINNSSDYILAFGGNFSMKTDSHLVCIQDLQNNENLYTTHAINIHNKPRKLTGASFIVFNGALKSSSGLTAKSSIVEDGLMIQITPDHMLKIRDDLRNMKDHTINCGCINSKTDEIVEILWTEPDKNFNLNVKSPIDDHPLNGVPSIRVHNGKDYINNNGQRLIRWSEVFIIKNNDNNDGDDDCYDNNDINYDNGRNDPVDISKISESIAKATCMALVKYLDLLISNNFYKIGIRTTLHVDNVSYLAGSNNMKLPPIYMKSLDNELIPVLHRITSNNFNDHHVVLELFFRILNK